MTVRDLSGLLSPHLDYPGILSKKHPKGHTYRVPSPDAEEGLRLTALMNLGLAASTGAELSDKDKSSLELGDDDERDLYRRLFGCNAECGTVQDGEKVVCGSAYDQMVEDGVPWMVLQAVAQDAMTYFGMSAEAADMMLEMRRQGEASAAPSNRAERRTAAKRTARKTAGSKSSPASSDTPARARNRASTRSSTTPDGEAAAAV